VLRRVRLAQRRTLADVAEVARVSVPYLSEVERGRKEASSEVLAAICEALRIHLSEVLTEVGRDLAADRAHHAPVVPLDAARAGRRPTTHSVVSGPAPASRVRPPGGGVMCLAA
jgi:transcriptional regulator with XRE-family HTH domain